MTNCKLYFLIVAAGKGLRMGSELKKQYVAIDNLPILSHTLSVFKQYDKPHEIILVVPKGDIEYCKENILKPLDIEKKVFLVPGGKERQDSVSIGIDMIKTLTDNYNNVVILIHDGVRPFIDHSLIDACIKGAIEFGACIPAIKTSDTIKIVKDKIVAETLDREYIYLIQTPQAFLLKIFINAMEYAKKQKFTGTDDASVVEFFGHTVAVIKGLRNNIKITTKDDLKFVKTFFSF